MTPEKFKRKLTAILSADVKGYSRLMGTDVFLQGTESGFLMTLSRMRYKQYHEGLRGIIVPVKALFHLLIYHR